MGAMETYFRQQAIGTGKRSRTRGALLDSAISVFADKGFEEASISEIAAIAGLANGTFYNHFKDKDALAAETAGAIALALARQLDVLMDDLKAGVSRIVVASIAFLRLASLHKPWGSVLLAQVQRDPRSGIRALHYMRSDVQRAVRQRDLDVTVDDFLLEQLGALMMVALRAQLDDGYDPVLLHRTCEHLLRVLGLTPKQARREVERVSNHPLLKEAFTLESVFSV